MKEAKKLSPFDFLNAINFTKQDLIVDDITEKAYVPFVVNRSLSYFQDTVLLANEMNINHIIDHKAQNLFYINTIRKRKRFSKWAKADEPADLEIVKKYYGYSNDRAREALSILSKEEISELKKRMNPGGKRK